jgi:hypothetical protein
MQDGGIFDRLGRDIEARWRAKDYAEPAFPSIVSAALREHDPAANVTPEQILENVLDGHLLPAQVPVAIDYPFTLYRGEQFRMLSYFWFDGTTDIHDHPFFGAFQVISGGSLHTTFDYEEHERISSRVSRGALQLRAFETLKRGDIREIVAGKGFIHSLFHLDRPSVTLLISTTARSGASSNISLTYLRPGLAVDPFVTETPLNPRLLALQAIAESRPEAYAGAVLRFVGQADAHSAIHVLLHAYEHLELDEFERLLEGARARHGALVPLLSEVFVGLRRDGNIRARRSLVRNPDHRYFLALVMNVPTPEDIQRLVRERVPNRDPVDTIVDWVKELADVPVQGEAGPTAIGVPLGDAELSVLRALLRGRDIGGVIEALSAEYDPADIAAQRDELVEMVDAFRESLFFSALLPRRK